MSDIDQLGALPLAYLMDAGALSSSELALLRQRDDVQWIYDHVGDPQAEALGPVLAAPAPTVQDLVEQVSRDPERTWSVGSLFADVCLKQLAQHLRSLRYVHTRDGQRYYWRFADSRCLTALWQTMSASQQTRAQGPIQRWQYVDRDGSHQQLALSPTTSGHVDRVAGGALVLSDQQLARLLDTVWPDQLLASVLEQRPDLAGQQTPAVRHHVARQTCVWLAQAKEDRYPIQQSVLLNVLPAAQMTWSASEWHDALSIAHRRAML